MKNRLFHLLNALFGRFGYTLKPTRRQASRHAVDTFAYLTTPHIFERYLSALAAIVHPFATEHLAPDLTPDATRNLLADFITTYKGRPITHNPNGAGFGGSLWLYVTARLRQPELIIESGTMHGHSVWLFRQACPDAEIHTFDISLHNLTHREPNVHYHECDWMAQPIEAAANSLIFFDCHVNQALRVAQAAERGFRFALFDDAAPIHHIAPWGQPAVPTIPMLFDKALTPGQTVEWVWHGQPRSYTHTPEQIHNAAALIKAYRAFPQIGDEMRQGHYAYLTAVWLA